tara:strand:- start:214 stop:1107 length:894 start_codon:yes stop_codon:yes gene_type:complete
MITPEKLKKGDKIGIISTARKISLEELDPAIKIIKSWSLQVELGENIFKEDNQFSGSLTQRALDLQTMIDDKSIKAIFCARGGYGTIQIIDRVNFSKIIQSPKWIIGYSDVTVLHSHLNTLRVPSLHASMPINFQENTRAAITSLKNVLFKTKNKIKTTSHFFNRPGKVSAEIVGGNLSILYSLLGSSSDINTDGRILLIEDLDEYLYHIDRMMMSLKRNRKFENLKGMIVGGMSNMNDNDIPFGKTAEQIILDYTKDYTFPICFRFPTGHLNDNRCVKFGVRSILEITEDGVSLSQ